MLRRVFLGVLTGAAVLVLPLAGVPAAQADPGVQLVTLTYDDSRATQYRSAIAQGVAIWNSRVTSVQIVRAAAGTTANVRVIADPGWPRANLGPIRPPNGRGSVWMGQQAVSQGYNVVRIAAHEFGHILGLPDNRTGRCTDLMSGSSAPVSCANATPSAAEASRVQQNYSSGFAAQQTNDQAVLIIDAG
ncbi:MAG TPA: snapalysin family zinc-dependent metalloprotease [Actinophytocola sp.]|uniref:snapalysin family zinc-dependent metalloprotease n=1 Tax=Actinophytocola sp. TaxID=1872138 RepID=UPI002DC020DF|nr:snapalysin family zinc-dependent metalloprotease [Actinophytocola sp.]HEU5471755.1 snapalysin family zinc-dependent metalloprotease [Actinophytocola sp.]